MKDIYDLKLHEKLLIKKIDITVIRVAGGWLYLDDQETTFVPYNNEFNN